MMLVDINARFRIKDIVAEILPNQDQHGGHHKFEKDASIQSLVSAKATQLPTKIGMIATLYMGGLSAASHNFRLCEVSIN